MRAPNKRTPMALVVEDDPAIARMLRIFLSASGFQVRETTHGAEALLVLERESPDAVILDLTLPDGQGGAILNRLREKDEHDAPAWVAITALDREEATIQYGSLGNHFLAKPFDPGVLLAMLRSALPGAGNVVQEDPRREQLSAAKATRKARPPAGARGPADTRGRNRPSRDLDAAHRQINVRCT